MWVKELEIRAWENGSQILQKKCCLINIWTLTLYKSGGFKSTALENGASLARNQSKESLRVIKEVDERLQNDNSKSGELIKQKLEASKRNPVLPNKMTTEALLELLGQGHSGVIITSEFGSWLQNMEKAHNVDMKSTLTDIYDVPLTYHYRTKGSGDYRIERPCFSINGVSNVP